jgi:hypothetical protein
MTTDKAVTGSGDAADSTNEGQPASVDIEQLAERIYDLMRSEVRLERARGVTAGFFGSE